MKKRVRVYKPGGQTNQPTQEQIVNYISQRMSADDFDGDTDALKAELAQAGVEDTMADDYISYVSDNLGLEDDTQLDEETQLAAEQEQARAQEEEQALLEEQQEAEEEARQAQLAAMYDTNIDMSTTEDTPEDEETYMQYGGAKPSKRSFINKYTKLAKKQMGGNSSTPSADDVLNGREAHVNGFLGAVKNTANDAILRQEAEAQYNSIYGTPQVGAFQEGGIHQEEIDPENPLHHLSTYGTDTRHIFSDDMYTQNDVAAMEQFGGNTGQGLYKFIGGGDNESADEQYQDADIDFNQESYQMGGFRMPRRSGRQYTQAVGSPYYTATGEAAAAPDLAGRQVSSVDVTKRGIFGRPKAYTVNYGNPNATVSSTTPQIKMPTEEEAKKLDAKYAAQERRSGNRQPVADWMMRSGIPGVKGLGAKMTKSGPIPVVPNVIPETYGNDKYDRNRLPSAQNINTPENQKQIDQGKQIETTISNQTNPIVPVNPIVKTPVTNTSNAPVVNQEQTNPLTPFVSEKQPATSSTDEEFCYPGGACITKSKDQIFDNEVFNDLPRQIRAHGIANNKDWMSGEGKNQELDLSKLSAQDVIDAINSQKGTVNSPFNKVEGDYNIDEYANKWLKFQQDNQREFGNKNYFDLSDYGIKNEGDSPNQQYAEWLNASGTPDPNDKNNILSTKSMLQLRQQKAYGGPIDYTEYAYGGDIAIPELHKYQMDGQVAFDPNANNMNISNLQGFFDKAPTKDVTGQTIQATIPESMQPKNITIDPNQPNKEAVTDQPDNYSQDYQVKRDWGQIGKDVADVAAVGKIGLLAGLDTLDKINARKQENQMLADTTAAESNYGISNEDNRGDYDPNSGLFRPNQMGAMQSKYGGGIYAMGGNTADEDEDVQYMTQEEIDDFLANGGELEYL